MKTEPTINTTALISTLEDAYALTIDHLTFFPTGWMAYCYILVCADGQRYFLKLHGDSTQAEFAASSRDFYLPLMDTLHASGLFPYIPRPIRTRDQRLLTHFDGYTAILYSFIDGHVVGHAGMTHEILAQLARLVGKLHRSTQNLTVADPLIETFAIPFEGTLIDALDRLPAIEAELRAGQRDLRALLLPHRQTLLAHMRRLKGLQGIARRANPQRVLCHTDLHGENLILDDRGILSILDWENAILAPPEHDLFFFTGHDTFWTVFLPNYEQTFGRTAIDCDLLAFYYYRRTLEDLSDWIVRILGGAADDAQDQADLAEIRQCLDDLAHIESTVIEIEARLTRQRA